METGGSLEESAGRWFDQSRYDWDTARTLFDSERYPYVLFFCQQAIEKALKGRILQATGKLPLRTHNLMKLLKVAAIEWDESGHDFLRELSAYYVQSRYPDVMDVPGIVTREATQRLLKQAEELLRWLPSIP